MRITTRWAAMAAMGLASMTESSRIWADQSDDARLRERSGEILRKLDESFATQKAEAEKVYDSPEPYGGAVLVARGDEVVYARGLGLANREWNIPATTDTKFEIWSVTKTFTAVAILQLQERGKLDIDDPICSHLSSHLNSCPTHWRAITIRQLLSHTSGLWDLNQDESGLGISRFGQDPCTLCRLKTTPKGVLAIYRDKPLAYQPGTHHAYSNFGYYLLGLIIEEAGGKPYEEVLKERIFLPAGMTSTGLNRSEQVLPKRAGKYAPDQAELNAYYAALESHSSGEKLPPKVALRNGGYQDPSWVFSAAALYSTVEDLFKYGRALTQGKLLSAEALKELWASVAVPFFMPSDSDPAEAATLKNARSDYALGWETKPIVGHHCFHHAGAGGSTGADFAICPDQDLTIVVLGYGMTGIPAFIDILYGRK